MPLTESDIVKIAPERDLADIQKAVEQELLFALRKWPPIASPHEGYAIIKEEVDELWKEIQIFQKTRHSANWHRLRHEAIQVAAMAIRLVYDFEAANEGFSV